MCIRLLPKENETSGLSEGGNDYPAKILKEDHRNLRVWIQDGSNDQENPQYGSWPMANVSMANALKLKDKWGTTRPEPAFGISTSLDE